MDYQCQTCRVVTTIDNEQDWFKILTEHHNRHVGTKWGPSYEIRRFIIFHPPCVRAGCNEIGTHNVRSEYFGCSYCDKHWNERDLNTESRLLMS